MNFNSLLVYSGCHNRILQTGGLKQQQFIFSQFWGLEAYDQGGSKVGFR